MLRLVFLIILTLLKSYKSRICYEHVTEWHGFLLSNKQTPTVLILEYK